MASNLPCRVRYNRHIGLYPQLLAGPLCGALRDVAAWGYENTGMEVLADQVRLDVYRNNRQGLSCEGRLCYKVRSVAAAASCG